MTQETVADQIVSVLVRQGVDCIFGQSIPTALMLSAERNHIRQIFYRTENAGGAMADGYARAAHRIGFVGAQNGPAATLLVPPLAEALAASIPVVAFVQEVPRATQDRNASQEIDHLSLFKSCTKWIVRLDDPARVEADLARALSRATEGRPGPVVVLTPRDILSQPAVGQSVREVPLCVYPLDRPRPDDAAVKRAAQLLAFAENPVVVAGGGVHSSAAYSELAALQDVASLPVATTVMGKGAVDESHELSIGVVGYAMGINSMTHSIRPYLAEADAVLLVGTRTNESGTDSWRLYSETATFIHLDIAPEELNRNYPSLRLMSDAKAGIRDLVDQLATLDLSHRNKRRSAIARRIGDARTADRATARFVTQSSSVPLRPERIMTELNDLLTADDVVVADASYATIWAAVYLESRQPGQRFLAPRGLGGLGWGLPMALGAKVANAGRRVVCIVGDGAFAHAWQEMETAARENLPVTIVLLNNGILGYQRHGEMHSYGQHTSATEFGPVDHAAIAQACGIQGVRVTEPSDIRDSFKLALESESPTLVEVMIDPGARPPITKWDNSKAFA